VDYVIFVMLQISACRNKPALSPLNHRVQMLLNFSNSGDIPNQTRPAVLSALVTGIYDWQYRSSRGDDGACPFNIPQFLSFRRRDGPTIHSTTPFFEACVNEAPTKRDRARAKDVCRKLYEIQWWERLNV